MILKIKKKIKRMRETISNYGKEFNPKPFPDGVYPTLRMLVANAQGTHPKQRLQYYRAMKQFIKELKCKFEWVYEEKNENS